MAIICATDLSEPAARAADVAAALASRTGERLVLVQAALLPDPEYPVRDAERLEAEAERLRRSHPIGVETVLELGAAESVAIDKARSANADLLVVGSGHRRLRRFFVGSTAERMVRQAPMPVLVVRPETASMLLDWAAGAAPLRVVVGLGLDECADAPMDVASRLFALGNCRLDFVHAVESPPLSYPGVAPETAPWLSESESRARGALVKLIDSRGLSGEIDVQIGRPASELVLIAQRKNAGLAIVGSHGRKGLDRMLLGSVSSSVLREAPCSVVVAPCNWRAAMTKGELHPGP